MCLLPLNRDALWYLNNKETKKYKSIYISGKSPGRPTYRNSRQSWILDYTPWTPHSRYWIPTTGSRTFWIQIVSGIADTLSCLPDSTTKFFQDSGFYKQKFPVFRDPDSFTRGYFWIFLVCPCDARSWDLNNTTTEAVSDSALRQNWINIGRWIKPTNTWEFWFCKLLFQVLYAKSWNDDLSHGRLIKWITDNNFEFRFL